ncbi:hypothetical protein K443DRAFT_562666 [Laccaria amethystina LaAM-08-1]|uniref:Uncharacterized protein n=1 Tax=Laccaria amethystina LaAM-08-1 TaxID=1095629 RepID=A0A0C9YKI2_9AGAR|nr:hypothetical protein K443DRAFT_562666 [Laccaria amethystina LaAM-08-1]
MEDAKHLNLFSCTFIDFATMHRWLSMVRERRGSNIPHMQIRRMRLKYSRIPQAVWKDIVGKGSAIEKEDCSDNTVKDRPLYDDYFWEHILSPSDREFLAKHDIHCGTVTNRVAALSDSFRLSGSPS